MPEATKRTKTKHPGIYQKGDRYQVRYRHNGRDALKSFRTLTEAKRFKAGVDKGETRPSGSKTFRAYANEWIETYTGRTAKGISDGARESYRDALDRFAKPYFGTAKLDRIDPPMVKAYIAHVAASKTKRGKMTPASVRRMYAPVRALLATAHEDGLISTNPAAGVRVVVKDTRPKMPKWLTPEQTKALLAEIPAEYADVVFLLASTGLRISEALNLRWRDLTVVDGRPHLEVVKSKTSAGERIIPLSPGTVRRLTARRSTARFATDNDLVFPSASGTAIDPRNFRRRVFAPAAERAFLPWATPHKLRHGMASLMAAQGHSAAQIAAYLGHADGGVLALKTYIHADHPDVAFVDEALS
ncbi:MAG TPA: tyrosine-type recombinase/integrase [Solirubrobacteraceae bacterium]|nr:tyrosine-type recombinase/integrase [Solirubrobacteraceae bacterium]